MFENRNILPNFPRDDAVVNIQLIIGHDHFAAQLYGPSFYPSLMCVLCKEGNFIMKRLSSRLHSFQILEYWFTCKIIPGWQKSNGIPPISWALNTTILLDQKSVTTQKTMNHTSY